MQEQGKKKTGERNEGEVEGAGIESVPAGAHGGRDSCKGEEIEEAKTGQGAGDEVGDGLPENEEAPSGPDAEGQQAEKGWNGEVPAIQEGWPFPDPPPGVGENTEEDEEPEEGSGDA